MQTKVKAPICCCQGERPAYWERARTAASFLCILFSLPSLFLRTWLSAGNNIAYDTFFCSYVRARECARPIAVQKAVAEYNVRWIIAKLRPCGPHFWRTIIFSLQLCDLPREIISVNRKNCPQLTFQLGWIMSVGYRWKKCASIPKTLMRANSNKVHFFVDLPLP